MPDTGGINGGKMFLVSQVLNPSLNMFSNIYNTRGYITKALVIKLEHILELPGGLIKTDSWVPPTDFIIQ